jgi:UDP-3-O-acyl-N-acetylglucosamine deacetylase
MTFQHTLASEAHFKGVGLHNGTSVNMVVGPAPEDSGIRFLVQPSGRPEPVVVPARADFLVSTDYCTTIGADGVTVKTIEHLMAALVGLGIDNADVWLDGDEVPVLDGSSALFVEALHRAGLALGATLENAVVIGEDGVMNPGGLRFDDEFVRHKVLDLIGDFALLGRPLWGHVVAHRSGHTLHAVAVRALLSRPACWEAIEAPVPAAALCATP